MYSSNYELHQYYLSSVGTALKEGYFVTRRDAEKAMHKYCNSHGLHVECVEDDKHSKLYATQNGATFCINRI